MSFLPPTELRQHHNRLLRLSLWFALPAAFTAYGVFVSWMFYFGLWLLRGNSENSLEVLRAALLSPFRMSSLETMIPFYLFLAFLAYGVIRSCWTAFSEIRDYCAYLADDEGAVVRIWRTLYLRRWLVSLGTVIVWAIPVTFVIGFICIWGMIASQSISVSPWMFWFRPFSFDGEARRFAEIEQRRNLEMDNLRGRGQDSDSTGPGTW